MNTTKRSVNWLKENLANSERLPYEALYKSPLALYLSNAKDASLSMINQMKDRGDLFYYSDDFTTNRNCDDYYNYWLFLYFYFSKNDLKETTYNKILQNFNEDNGGFSCKNGESLYETRSTAFSGICAYLNNDILIGEKTSNFLISNFVTNQTKNHFYMIRYKNNEYVTKYPEKFARLYDFYDNDGSPLYYAFSLAVINLAIGYLKTNEIKYLEYAEKYYNIIISIGDQAIFNNYIGKFGIASNLLYIITENTIYQEYCEKVEIYLQDSQLELGCWEDYASNNILSLDRTSEFTASIHMMKLIRKMDIKKLSIR